MTDQPIIFPDDEPQECTSLRYGDRIIHLLACIQQEFAKCKIDLCYLGWMPGAQVDMLHVGEGGSMAWVRVVSIEPVLERNTYHCTQPLSVSLELGFVTCYQIKEEPNTIQEDLELSIAVLHGQQALLRAALCCEWADREARTVSIGTWSAFGPEGGAVGGTWGLSFDSGA